MMPLELLKAHYEIWGLSAPKFTWWAAALLLILPLIVLAYLIVIVRRESRILASATSSIEKLKSQIAAPGTHGLSATIYESLAQIFANSIPLSAGWQAFKALIVQQRNAAGEVQYWSSDSSEVAFSEATVFEGRINRPFFTAIPGVVTGTGLLFTFLAILVALLDVRIVKGNQVEGLSLLIEGLSGKFVSSIGALFGATVFLVAEKPLLHRLTRMRLRLVQAVDDLVPRLTQVRVLAEMQQAISEQSASFRAFHDDLPAKLQQSFSEGVGPTLQRTADSIERLSQLLKDTEERKQQSITETLRGMLEDVQRSISTSLEEMGARFKDALSATTMEEFRNVSESLAGTTNLLQNMNAQFQMNQSALNELVEMARASTADQIELGKQQVGDLNQVLRQFMVQMNETAGSSVIRMGTALTSVVQNLSLSVNELEKKMAVSMQENTQKATGAASVVLEQAGTWSARSTEQLGQLIRQHESQIRNVKEMEVALISALAMFNTTFQKYAALNGDLSLIAREVSATAAASTAATQAMQEAQKSVEKIAAQAAQHLEQANRAQKEVWTWIHDNIEQYKDIFGLTEKRAKDLLSQMSQNLDSHIEAHRQVYERLISTADGQMARATQKLGASVSDLAAFLQYLTDSLKRAGGSGDGRRS